MWTCSTAPKTLSRPSSSCSCPKRWISSTLNVPTAQSRRFCALRRRMRRATCSAAIWAIRFRHTRRPYSASSFNPTLSRLVKMPLLPLPPVNFVPKSRQFSWKFQRNFGNFLGEKVKSSLDFYLEVNSTNPEDPAQTKDNKLAISLPIQVETDLSIRG